MPDTWTPLLLGVVGVCVFLYGFSKTAMPVAGVLAGPVLAAALGAPVASGLMVPLLILGDLFALAFYRQHADWGLIRRILPGILLGFLLTALLFVTLSLTALGRVIGVLILVSVVLEVWRRRNPVPPDARPHRGASLFFGTLAGMTTMAANAGGAAMTLYLINMRVSMLAFMGTSAWFFFVLNVLKVPIVGSLGFITTDSLLAGLWLAPFMVVGALAGVWTFRRMNERVFTAAALCLSALAALWLIVHG